VTRDELLELGYIVPIATVPSILSRGILSHRRAENVPHESIALEGVQGRRASVIVPNGRPLHEYANLYICPRNPMLLKRSALHTEICVLRVSPDVLEIPNVIVTDSNAGSKYVRFSPAPGGLRIVNGERTFARWWNHPEDQIDQWRHSAQKCAEVLVPDRVPTRYISGAYASCDKSAQALVDVGFNLPVARDGDLFFR
jgi:hypothetical protein